MGTGEGLLARAMGGRAFTTPDTPKSGDITCIPGAEVKLEGMLFVNLTRCTSGSQCHTQVIGGNIGGYLSETWSCRQQIMHMECCQPMNRWQCQGNTRSRVPERKNRELVGRIYGDVQPTWE